jgi:hypothetical protein
MAQQTEVLSIKISKPLKHDFEHWCWQHKESKTSVMRMLIQNLLEGETQNVKT